MTKAGRGLSTSRKQQLDLRVESRKAKIHLRRDQVPTGKLNVKQRNKTRAVKALAATKSGLGIAQ